MGGGVRAPKYLSGLERAGSAVVHIFPLNVGLWSQVERQRAIPSNFQCPRNFSQTARAHSSSLSERVSDTHTVPPGIPHSRLDGPHELGDELEHVVVGIEVPQLADRHVGVQQMHHVPRHCPTEDRGRHGDAHIFRYGAAQRAPLAAAQPLAPSGPNPQPHNESCPIPSACAARALPTIPSVCASAPISEIPCSQHIPPLSLTTPSQV